MRPARCTFTVPRNSRNTRPGRIKPKGKTMNIDKKIVDDLVANDVSFVTTVPCKQLALMLLLLPRKMLIGLQKVL